jgi:hypothetical protein
VSANKRSGVKQNKPSMDWQVKGTLFC